MTRVVSVLVAVGLLVGVGPLAGRADAATDAATVAVTASPTTIANPPISVAIDDGVTAAHAGQQLTYVATVDNVPGPSDVQVLLELTLPAHATATDTGGGTIRGGLVDFALTIGAGVKVSRSVVVTLGAVAAGEGNLTALASVFVLGQSEDTAAPAIRAVDTDNVTLVAAPERPAGAREQALSASLTGGTRNTGWWIGLLVLGLLLIGVGALLALQRSSNGRRRAGRDHPPDLAEPTGWSFAPANRTGASARRSTHHGTHCSGHPIPRSGAHSPH